MSEPVVYEPDYSGRSAGAAARLALHLEPRRDYRTQYFFRFLSFLTVKNAPDSCNCGRTRRKSMTKTRLLPSLTLISGLASIGILLATTSNVGARDKPKRETIHATAMGLRLGCGDWRHRRECRKRRRHWRRSGNDSGGGHKGRKGDRSQRDTA